MEITLTSCGHGGLAPDPRDDRGLNSNAPND
jgi:hypothetical protein